MLCYADKTFCSYWKECKKGLSCNRALTDIILKRAQKWSEGIKADDILICQFGDKPECFEEK